MSGSRLPRSLPGAYLGLYRSPVSGSRLPLAVGRLHLMINTLHHGVTGAAPGLQRGDHPRHRLRPDVPAGGVLHLKVSAQLVQLTADHVCGQGRVGQGGSRQLVQLPADHVCGQGGAGQVRAGQGRAGQGRAGQGRAGQGRAGQGHDMAWQGRAGQGRAGQDRARQGRAHTHWQPVGSCQDAHRAAG